MLINPSLLIGLCLGASALWPSTMAAQEPQPGAADEAALLVATRESLAADYCRRAIEASQLEPATTLALKLAAELLRVADSLDPDEQEILRASLSIATLGEDFAARKEFVERLSRIDPADERIRLIRINDALSRYGNADELVSAYLVLLKDDNIRKLGAPIASRLATALAVIEQRLGESDEYAAWISRAATLDQTNKEAAALMAGYFQQHVTGDAFGQAELLVNLLLADPVDISTQSALARHLLEHGAYEGAARLYRLAVATHAAFRQSPGPDLVADYVLAVWASGEPEAALETIKGYQQQLNEAMQMRAWAENPELSPEERAAITGILPPTLAVVHLTLLDLTDPATAGEALARLQEAFTSALAAGEQSPSDRRDALLAQAWLAAWFGRDAPAIQSYVDQAAALAPLDHATAARYDAWIALRSGDLERAEAILTVAPSEPDPTLTAALALLRIEQGRPEDSRELFASVAEQDRGSALGLWARARAAALAGALPAPPAIAARLNELVESIPDTVDRIPADRQFGMSLRIEPIDPPFDEFGPMLVRLVVTNHTGLPIGISPEGPLRPNMIIESTLSAPNQPRITKGAPIVIDFGRRLRLAPRERLELVIDLRRNALGELIEACGTGGATIQLRGILNPFPANESLIEPGPLGYVSRSIEFRVNGARVTGEWLAAMTVRLHDGQPIGHGELGLLTQAILWNAVAQRPPAPELAAAFTEAAAALEAAYPRFDPIVQAWILAVLPRGAPTLPGILAAAKQSTSPHVQLAFLMNHLEGAADPALAAAMASEHADVSRIAGLVQQLFDQQAAAQKMNLQNQGQPAPPASGGQGR
jgi:hypothetical protein